MLSNVNGKTKVHVVPVPGNFPRRGGVREHIIQLYNCFGRHKRVGVCLDEDRADVVHVESSYKAQHRKPDVYVCHGGFEPPPTIQAVADNLKQATVIVSVARWLVDKYFPQYWHKTVIIPNGVNLKEWKDVPASGIQPGYILYAKEWCYHIDDFIRLAELMPNQRFVSTVWPDGIKQLENVEVIGLQSREVIRSVIKDAAALMLTGPEVCPTMLLEAWASKTPVVAKVGGGNSEIMQGQSMYLTQRPGDTRYDIAGGYLYNTLDELIEYISLLRDAHVRQELGVGGHKRVVEKYQWCNLFEEYVRLYAAIEYDELEAYFAQAREGSKEVVG